MDLRGAQAVLPHEVEPDPQRSLPLDGLAPPAAKRGKRQTRNRFVSAPVEVRLNHALPPIERRSSRFHERQAPSARSSFHELLARLAEQHDSEIATLHAENAVLRAQQNQQDVGEACPSEICPSEASELASGGFSHGVTSSLSMHSRGFFTAAQSRGQAFAMPDLMPWNGIQKSKSIKEDGPLCLLPPAKQKDSVDANEMGTTMTTMMSITSGAGAVSATNSRRQSACSVFRKASLGQLEVMKPLPVWQEREAKTKAQRRMSTQVNVPIRLSKARQAAAIGEEDVYQRSERCAERCALHPSSVKRLAWDLMGFAFLSYDIVLIPFASAFDTGDSPAMDAMNFVTLCFWSLDMIASMITGFQRGGVTVMNHKQIIARYIKSWFVLDFFIVGLDWLTLLAYGNSNEAVRQGRSLRLLRYVRTIRLIRLLKLKRMFHEIQDHLNTEMLSTVFSILRTIIGLVVANHLIACAWYALGVSFSDDEPSWVTANEIEDRSVTYKYVTSLHWSLTQFTPASMEIRPYNEAERVFSVVVLLLALVSFSSFVSTLTASITRLSAMRSNEQRQFWLLRRYLRELQISRQLSLRVQRYCEYSWDRHYQSVQERDVHLLSYLSQPLREELKAETFARFLSVHPLIEQLQDAVRCFSSALTALEIARGDQVFAYGEVAPKMFVVARGELQYTVREDESVMEVNMKTDSSMTDSSGVDSVYEGDWVSEATLWTAWDHLGDLEALTDCQLVAINAGAFGEVVSQNAGTLLSAQRYAKRFLEQLNKVDKRKLTDVLDRMLTYTAAEEIGCAVPAPGDSYGGRRRPHRRNSLVAAELAFRRGRYCMFRLWLSAQSTLNGLRNNFF